MWPWVLAVSVVGAWAIGHDGRWAPLMIVCAIVVGLVFARRDERR